MEFPADFIKIIENLPGVDKEKFFESMQQNPPVSIRLNSRKMTAINKGNLPVAWSKNSFYLPDRPQFIFDPLFHAGAYYVQEASSTIYETLTEIIVKELGDNKINVLDLCAAPGGKTTAMINALPDGSFVWANEYDARRTAILRENLFKWGYTNIRVSNLDSSYFSSGEIKFDVVAVDAPCSGEGMMRKDEFARKQWSLDLVKECASRQKKILKNAAAAVADGGFLVYSTCTFNRTENEENALYIKEVLGLDPFDPEFPDEWGILKGIETDLPVYRFMPHATKGEGLFLSVFRKPGEWEPTNIFIKPETGKEKKFKDGKRSRQKSEGRPEKERDNHKYEKSNEEIPIENILAFDFNGEGIPDAHLSKEEALSYLRGESISLSANAPRGTVIVKYEGLPLGAVKNIGTRANNLYPKPWRIKKQG